MSDAPTNPTNAETNQKEIICSGCSAKLVYSPGSRHLKCEFCGAENEIEIKDEPINELHFQAYLKQMAGSADKETILTVKCDACGAETTLEPNVVADTCVFCGNHLVVKEGTSCSIIKPKSILPFDVEKNKAYGLFKNWINKLWFAPGDLKKYAQQTGKLAGMYIPYWTYDSHTQTRYSGQRGDDYTETEHYTNSSGNSATRKVTRTDWTSVSGTVRKFFDDILIIASKSLPKKYLKKLEPWDLKNLIPFDEKFLSGFRAESYQVELKDGFTEAQEIMKTEITQLVKKDIGGDHQRISSQSTDYNNITFKHILLPVWLSAYRYNNKVYRFMINARTGEVSGERPYSAGKIFLAIVGALIIIAGIAYAIWYFNQQGQTVDQNY